PPPPFGSVAFEGSVNDPPPPPPQPATSRAASSIARHSPPSLRARILPRGAVRITGTLTGLGRRHRQPQLEPRTVSRLALHLQLSAHNPHALGARVQPQVHPHQVAVERAVEVEADAVVAHTEHQLA